MWLATQTLRSDARRERHHVAYSTLTRTAEDRQATIRRVEFVAAQQQIRVELVNGERLQTTYPTEAAQLDFQKTLERQRIPFDARRGAPARWSSILTTLLPFVLLFGGWIALMRIARRRSPDESAPDDESRRWWNG